jgi:hypothetical protein
MLLTSCDGLKEALTAHVDVVAKAGSQELSVTRLADMLGNAKLQIPVTRENAAIIADLWTGYQQIAFAAAHGDSLNDKKAIDIAATPITNTSKLRQFMEGVVKSYKADSGSEAAYNQAAGGLLAARHILLMYPPAATATQKDSVRKRAEAIRAQVTSANFTDMAKKHSGDPAVAQNAGNYGVFARTDMVPEFSNATAALKPGEISAPVASQYGYHIIQRLPYAEVKDQFAQRYSQAAMGSADSAYMAKLDSNAKFVIKDNAPTLAKDAARDPQKHWNDNAALVTYKGGELTVAEFLDWVGMIPPGQRVMQQIPGAPDSVLKPFMRGMAEREVLLQRADSAKITITAEERNSLYTEFQTLVSQLWQALNVDPKSLADSAKSTAERERVAAARVEADLDRVLSGQMQPVPVPVPIKKILNQKYEASINQAGLDRAFERAQKVRATADSARTANQPKSEVPLPGGVPTAPPTATQPPASTQPPPAAAPKKP